MKSIEDQPRYVIDQEAPAKETKILSDEQERVINKLIKAAGHILDADERELLNRLQEKLHQETARVRSLKKMTASDKPLDAYLSGMKNHKKNHSTGLKGTNHSTDQNETDQEFLEGDFSESEEPVERTPVRTTIVGFKPEEVVQRYIECWNQQKFGAEYDCFSKEFMRTDRDAYVSARHTYFQQQLNQGGMKINLGEILSSNVNGTTAEIVASKSIRVGSRKTQEEKDLYRLKLEQGRWVICGVEPK